MSTETYIALSAIVLILFTEISKKHAAAASGFGGDVIYHCTDTCFIPLFAFIVYGGGDVQMVEFVTLTRIFNLRCLFALIVFYDAAFGQ